MPDSKDNWVGLHIAQMKDKQTDPAILLAQCHRENAGTLGWYPSCLSPPRSPLKGDIPNKYPLYKVYMGLIIKGTIPRVPAFSL